MTRFGMMVTRFALVAIISAAVVSSAGAEEPAPASSLVDARDAMEGAEFPRALDSIAAAIGGGALEPRELQECYRLKGEALVALGKPEEARAAFSVLLILDPEAQLGELVSPKITEELNAARESLAGQKLSIEYDLDEETKQASLRVLADPQSMAFEAELSYGRENGREARIRSRVLDGVASLDLPAGASDSLQLGLIDNHGNYLARFVLDYKPANAKLVIAPTNTKIGTSATPLWSRWWVWAAGSASFAVVAGTLGLASQSSEKSLDSVLATPGEHFYSEAEALEHTARSRARWANASFAVAGGLGIASAYFFWRGAGEGSKTETVVVPSADASGASLLWRGSF